MTIKKFRRKVVTRSPKRKVGFVNCRWFQNEPIEHESELEKHFIHCAMLCPDVLKIKSQPFTLELGEKIYTPDFLVIFLSGASLVVEVKISRKVGAYLDTFNSAQETLGDRHKFFVLTEKVIDRLSQAEVAAQILRYAKSEFSAEMLHRVLQKGAELGSPYISIADLAAASQAPTEAVLHLVARRCLTLHQDDFVSPDSRVFLPTPAYMEAHETFSRHFEVLPWNPNDGIEPVQRKKRERMRKRAAVSREPFVRQRSANLAKPDAGALASVAGGIPVPVRKRRPGSSH